MTSFRTDLDLVREFLRMNDVGKVDLFYLAKSHKANEHCQRQSNVCRKVTRLEVQGMFIVVGIEDGRVL